MKNRVPIYWPLPRSFAIMIIGGGLIWFGVIWLVLHALVKP